MNGCMKVRERLAEYALSGLAPDERAAVEQHVEWCAGCRKELEQLQAAAAGLGRSLEPVEPPRSLEDRVVRTVRRAVRRGSAPRQPRRWTSAVASAAAVLVAAAAIFYASVVTGRLKDAQTERDNVEVALDREKDRAEWLADRVRQLIEEIASIAQTGSEVRQIQLVPAASGLQGGGAVLLVDNATQHYAFVLLGGLPVEAAPYRVTLLSPAGQVVNLVIDELDGGGGVERLIDNAESLEGVRRVVVRDRAGNKVLIGALIVVQASPNA